METIIYKVSRYKELLGIYTSLREALESIQIKYNGLFIRNFDHEKGIEQLHIPKAMENFKTTKTMEFCYLNEVGFIDQSIGKISLESYSIDFDKLEITQETIS